MLIFFSKLNCKLLYKSICNLPVLSVFSAILVNYPVEKENILFTIILLSVLAGNDSTYIIIKLFKTANTTRLQELKCY